MQIQHFAAAGLALALSVQTASAQGSASKAPNRVESSIPTAADETQIDALINPVLGAIHQGKVGAAITTFMFSSPFSAQRGTEVNLFASQADATVMAIGPSSTCLLNEKRSQTAIDEARVYVCSHDKAATRWVFRMVKTTRGWIAANLYFDDKPFKGIDDCPAGSCG